MNVFRASSNRRALAGVIFALALASAPAAVAQDRQAGRDKAAACAVCHGPLGIGQMANVPNLAGQPESYLATQLKAYRDGRRADEIMTIVAKPLNDADIADLSAWFASIKINAEATD